MGITLWRSTGYLRRSGVSAYLSFLALSFAAAVAAWLADAAIFRLSVYPEYIEPESYAGSFEQVLAGEQNRQLWGQHRVLVFGDSAIAEGFSARLANEATASRDWCFSSAGMPAATPRAWFYLLRELDPSANRYNVIALPLADYDDADGLEPPDVDIEADRDLDLNRLIGRLEIRDIVPFSTSYRDAGKRAWSLFGSTFKGAIYSRDVEEFVHDPGNRFRKVELYDAGSVHWRDNYEGQAGSLAGLQYDSSTGEFTFPDSFDTTTKQQLIERVRPQHLSVRGIRRAYRELWLGRIMDHYRGKGAEIVFFRMPNRPFGVHLATQYRKPPTFVEKASRRRDVAVLERDTFAEFERPENFFDIYHLNAAARVRFSQMFAARVQAAAVKR